MYLYNCKALPKILLTIIFIIGRGFLFQKALATGDFFFLRNSNNGFIAQCSSNVMSRTLKGEKKGELLMKVQARA